MFHVSDNLFFGRKANGDVRVLKFSGNPTIDYPTLSADMHLGEPLNDNARVRVLADITIGATSWASVVSSVSALGEGNLRYYTALAFHNDVKP